MIIDTDHGEVIQQTIEELRRNPGLMGVLLYGSVSRGEFDVHSDVDIAAVYEEGDEIIKNDNFDGVYRDIHIFSFERILRLLIIKQDHCMVRAFACGKVIFEGDRKFGLLKQLAELTFKSRSRMLKLEYYFTKRNRFCNLLAETERNLGSAEKALFLMNFTFVEVIRDLPFLTRTWTTKRTQVLEAIDEQDPVLHDFCKDYLQEGELEKKYRCLEKIVKYVLEPLGGFPPEEWELPVRTGQQLYELLPGLEKLLWKE
ncbi:nucleotidyltransferase domain-containing protein [candidate division WOR-3 bacterium]|nr:nucleotidyltransferase domain-containing protein [candidate division WOR-3 bacterium]